MDILNTKRKRIFGLLVATIGCLFFNSNLNAVAEVDFVTLEATLEATWGESLTVTANNLLSNSLSNRMTNVKGCLADPFVYGIYSYTDRKNIVAGYGYKNHTYGLVLGVDDVWTFANEKYFRLGVALGYVHGKITPSDTLSLTERDSSTTFDVDLNLYNIDNFNYDVYAMRLFGAYESFDDKCLKTNIGVIFGYNYGRDKFHMNPGDDCLFKSVSSGISLGVEFIKNLYAYKGYQFGLWLQENYGHTFQYMNLMISDRETQTNPGYDFFATIIGFNMEKETFERADKKLTLSLKAGWEYRVIQSFNTNIVIVGIPMSEYNQYAISRHPVRNAAVVSFKALQKLSDHWDIVGSYSARFSKDLLAHNISCGAEYSF
ncbi:MAG: autotransporter outer membrane beta-barrel domain-containing protein [Puniceicoccales bacterium]|nr:autotransporter outer membrane beta-barrel domain-containing protein [Puniceicoccales bacterium]